MIILEERKAYRKSKVTRANAKNFKVVLVKTIWYPQSGRRTWRDAEPRHWTQAFLVIWNLPEVPMRKGQIVIYLMHSVWINALFHLEKNNIINPLHPKINWIWIKHTLIYTYIRKSNRTSLKYQKREGLLNIECGSPGHSVTLLGRPPGMITGQARTVRLLRGLHVLDTSSHLHWWPTMLSHSGRMASSSCSVPPGPHALHLSL